MEINLEESHIESASDLEREEPQSRHWARTLVDVLETLILSAVLFLGINAVSARVRVEGSSMEPSLHDGEFVIVNRLAYRFGTPEHGDVVVFHYPRNPEEENIKRIIGKAGDQVRIVDGQVFVNDDMIDESYIAAPPRYTGEWEVPEGSLFVLGDNRNNSSDSHVWGPLSMDFVIGKAIFVYWPLTDWGSIEQVNPVAGQVSQP
jgi:signal peptidase I